jgi:hypothetical protein
MNRPLLHDDDDTYLEMEEQKEEADSVNIKFILDLYDSILAKQQKTIDDGLYESDFLCDMISTENNTYYWLALDSPIARTLADNEFAAEQIFQGKCGNVVVYHRDDIESCVSQLIELCMEHGLKINKK